MIKRLFAALLSGLLAAFLPACDVVNLDKLKPGVTTMAQTVSALLPTSLTKPLLRREHGGQVVGWARRQGRSAS